MSTTVLTHSRSGLAPDERHRQFDVLPRGERRKQVEGLEDEADALAADLRQLAVAERPEVDVALRSVQVDLAGGQRVEAGEAVHQRALAGAGRPHDRGEAAGGQADRDVVEGEDRGVALAVALGGGLGASGERHGRRPPGQGLEGGRVEGRASADALIEEPSRDVVVVIPTTVKIQRFRAHWSAPVCRRWGFPQWGRPYPSRAVRTMLR